MTTRLITPPVSEPISLVEAKLHLRVDHNAEDTLITALITSAREQCEHILGRSLMPQTWEAILDDFPLDNDIELLNPNIISITSIKYIDALTANETTLASNQYALDKDSEPGWVMPAYGVTWPETLAIANAVRIRYVAGYADAASVPASIKAWILLAIGVAYKQREALAENTLAKLPHDFYEGLLDRYRIWRI
ncbi:MAG: head-tail connector protein [Methylotenera sp.]|nr:head-tail connector protein [Methylotenera sp.]